MGNGTSLESLKNSKIVYLDINGKKEKILFSRYCSANDIMSLIAQASGVNKHSKIDLRNNEGAHVSLTPTMPLNTEATAYKVSIQEMPVLSGEHEAIQAILAEVAGQFNRVVHMDQLRAEVSNRLTVIEKRMELEGLKSVEIEKCKRDITTIKDTIWNAQKKFIDFNRMSKEKDAAKITLKKNPPSFEKYTLSKETIDYLKMPTFDIWHWEPNEMLSLLEHMYHELGLVKEFNINPITLKRWLLCVQENYHNNPFHNFRHCFCVTQMMYGMINLCKLWNMMNQEDLGILMTAAVCHDLDHPGYNNTYQINARTDLAIRYNDISPLENHHCAVAFQILSNPECNIFANVDKDTFKRIRAGMTMLILATDMARHAEIMENFRERLSIGFDSKSKDHIDTGMILLILATDMARHNDILEAFKEKMKGFDSKNVQHQDLLKMVLIKCCDISNEVRPMEVSEPWVDCLLEEYFNQSDREKSEGLPVAPFMDRDKVTKPTAQIGFIKFVLIPMFETASQLFPEIENEMVITLRKAHARYEDLKKDQEKEKKETPAVEVRKSSISDDSKKVSIRKASETQKTATKSTTP